MSECKGRIAVSTKIDAEMRDFLDDDAERFGVYRAEVAREAFDVYRKLRCAQFGCPHCGQPIQIEL
jgi:hypothetical protein